MRYAIPCLLLATNAYAADVEIVGTVSSKCVITTEKSGVYANPSADKLTTSGAGGVQPIVRLDVSLADAYLAKITYPTSFSTSPTLGDVVNWSGSTEVTQVSDSQMSAYDTNKVTYNSTTEYDLTIAGSTWFGINSEAVYGYGKALPQGEYRSVVVVECIAK